MRNRGKGERLVKEGKEGRSEKQVRKEESREWRIKIKRKGREK